MKPAPTVELTDRVLPDESRMRSSGSRLTSLWTLYTLTIRQHLHGKRWMVMAVLFLFPPALAVLLRLTAPDVPPIGLEFTLAFMFIPQALLPLIALVYASGIIQDEQEEQTLTYLLIRPIPRWAIYGVKLLATLTTTVVLTIIFTLLTYAAIYIGGNLGVAELTSRAVKAAAIHSLAVSAYCCLFGLMSLLTKRALIVGILYSAIFEGLLANMPFSIRLITIIYYTRLIAYKSIGFIFVGPRGHVENIAGAAWQFDPNDPLLLQHPRMRACLAVLFTASIVCTVIASVICVRREFHVKTPEGS